MILNQASHSQPRAQQSFQTRKTQNQNCGRNEWLAQAEERLSRGEATWEVSAVFWGEEMRVETGGQHWGWGRGGSGRDTGTSACQHYLPANSLGLSKTWIPLNTVKCRLLHLESGSTGARGGICIVLNSQGHLQIIGPLLSYPPVTLLPFSSRTSTFSLCSLISSHSLKNCVLLHSQFHLLPRCVIFVNFTQLWEKIVFNNWKNKLYATYPQT